MRWVSSVVVKFDRVETRQNVPRITERMQDNLEYLPGLLIVIKHMMLSSNFCCTIIVVALAFKLLPSDSFDLRYINHVDLQILTSSTTEAGEIGKPEFTDRRDDISAAFTYLWCFERKLGSIRQLMDMRRRRERKIKRRNPQGSTGRQSNQTTPQQRYKTTYFPGRSYPTTGNSAW